MINVCLADNYPVVHFGVKAYFKDHIDISIVSNVGNFSMIDEALKNKKIDILVLDLELEGLSSIFDVKSILKNHPNTKVLIYTSLSEQMYAPNAIKIGVAGFVHRSAKLETLGNTIIKIHQGFIVVSDAVRRSIDLISKQPKSERLYRKISNREIEVLRYLSEGKKNNEISKILGLNEKTISTYKLRLLTKLNVTNLVDLVNKAKTLQIV